LRARQGLNKARALTHAVKPIAEFEALNSKPSMTWVKICGITNLEDALTAVDAGADALGFVFWDKSPRKVDVETAREIVAELPVQLEKVGVFVNEREDIICEAVDRAGLTAVQMHGENEDPHVADLLVSRRSSLKIVAGISMHRPNPEGWAMMWRPGAVHAYLVDSGTSPKPGGTGEAFDWNASAPSIDVIKRLGKVVVAGGLKPSNVANAIDILKPFGVDVSSGVEARPGKKDPDKVRAFIKAVRRPMTTHKAEHGTLDNL
jgi:phosphoribosylanthranilate isomerase